ncbi:MAG TPA: hypothetical protein VIC55_04140, partial [Gemmatimonadaceae bacterium]
MAIRLNTTETEEVRSSESGWRRARVTPSLAEAYRTIPIPSFSRWRKALAFAGPGFLVAVGYMD